jgi:putative hydrolase of HD superfamily
VGLLLESATLKRVPRAGWMTRGVPHVESVAEHSFGVALMALTLLDHVRERGDQESLDRGKVLAIALLHDLAELRLMDLPAGAGRLLPPGVKSQAEATAMADLLAPLPSGDRLQDWWREFEDGSSPEGRLVRDADKLEMMVQCLRYEQAGSRGLEEFWAASDQRAWFYPLSAEIYAQLRARRQDTRRER